MTITLPGCAAPAPVSGPHPVRRPEPGWAPYSPCSPRCLPPPVGPVPVLRAVALAGLVAVAVAGAPLLFGAARGRWLRAFCRAALRTAGVRLRVVGPARFVATGGVLVVANHLSWIDVLALTAVQPVRMLSKREVRQWPVIGGLATRTGALFVDRAGLRSLPVTVAETAAALRAGSAVGVFPEGTTWCGAAAGAFRRATFQAALDAGVPVRPVAITLRLPGGGAAGTAAFVGDQTLWDSVRRVLRLRGTDCELTVLPLILPGRLDGRRELARRSQEAIGAVTGITHGAG